MKISFLELHILLEYILDRHKILSLDDLMEFLMHNPDLTLTIESEEPIQ